MKRWAETDLWGEDWFLALPADHKLLYHWLSQRGCDAAGVVRWNDLVAGFETSLPSPDIDGLVAASNGRVMLLPNGRYWLTEFIRTQYPSGVSATAKAHGCLRESIILNNLQSVCPKFGQSLLKWDKAAKAGNNERGSWQASPLQLQFNRCFGRRDSTPWNEKELRAFSKIPLEICSPEAMEILIAYYTATIAEEKDFRRRSLDTMLNNLQTEFDRSEKWAKTGRKRPEKPSETRASLKDRLAEAEREIAAIEARMRDGERSEKLAEKKGLLEGRVYELEMKLRLHA